VKFHKQTVNYSLYTVKGKLYLDSSRGKVEIPLSAQAEIFRIYIGKEVRKIERDRRKESA